MFKYNLYFFCEKKTEKTIKYFLSKYNADSGKLLVDEVLVYRNIESLSQNNLHEEWVEITDTNSWIKLGLSEQSIAFSINYSLPIKSITGLVITFTIDGGIIFGIEFDENEINLKYSKKLANTVGKEYDATLVALFIEETPIFSKDLFKKALCERAIYKVINCNSEVDMSISNQVKEM